ncbi:ABC transporter permease subunit [Streptosporangiaceae bacterium NEAU-GS5]|nr:ABC transporter permease subunit [Streptosporangiaceae bacterium NEAU-GS5]
MNRDALRRGLIDRAVLRAEWTKFRTVRGWVAGTVAAVLLIVALAMLLAGGSHTSCSNGPVEVACPALPIGPGGQAVTDRFYFAHRELTGDGTLTVRVASMSGIITYPPPDHDEIVPGLVPWAKAGIIVKQSLRVGAPYAAVMLTGKQGVHMQDDFVHDTPGPAGARWLRLARSGDAITGYASADGIRWTAIDTVRLQGLPRTVRIGMFVTSPSDLSVSRNSLGGSITQARFTQASATFDHVTPGGPWSRDEVGGHEGMTDWERYHRANGVSESGGTVTVTGTGDIAPRMDAVKPEVSLTGVAPGLIVLVVVAVTFVTAEYRRGLIRTTLLATPGRGRVLAAKAVVAGAVAFAAGLVAAAVALALGTKMLTAGGNQVLPVSALTEVRVVVGAAALLAACAVTALALGALSRRGMVAVTAAIAVIIVPWTLATASILPDEAARWLLCLTPAAGFAALQAIPAYPQVVAHYAPADGYYPLPPWAGLAVSFGYAALALAFALVRLRRADA